MSILNVNKINPVGGGSTVIIAGIASVTDSISVGNSVTASSFHGDGSQLTGIDSSAISSGGSVKIQANSSGATVTGVLTATNVSVGSSVTAATFHGSGANLTGLPASGLFSSYAIIADQKSQGTDGGASTAGTWHTRDLNTELSDPDGIVSISSNQFTLQAGNYFIEARAPSYQPSRHRLKLYQTSGTPADVAFGTNEFMSYGSGTAANAVQTTAFLSCRITISTATTYEIRHYIQAAKAGNGLGVAVSQGVELYCLVKIFKET